MFLSPLTVMVLTYSDQLDERYGEVVLIRNICVHVLLVDAVQGEPEQRQQRRYGEAEIELQQARQLRPGLYLQERGEERESDEDKCSLKPQYVQVLVN